MTFAVDPLALTGYAAMLTRAGEDARECRTYFTGNVPDLSPGVDGLINPICYEHVLVQRKLATMLDQLQVLLASSRDEIARAAAHYRQSDVESAALIDDTCPESARPLPRTA